MRERALRGVLTEDFDWPLFGITVLISCLGLFFLYSATPDRSLSLHNVFYRQLIWFFIAFLVFWVTLWLDYKSFLNWAYLLYGINLLLLVLVLLLGRATRLGAQRWLGVGPFAIQPSEFAKITLVLVLSRFLQGRDLNSNLLRTLGLILGFCAFPAFLILKEPHLGTALLLFFVLLILLYVAGLRLSLLIGFLTTVALLSPLGWFFLKPYQRERLLVFVNPNVDPLGSGYTIIQSRISIGSGGLFGKGWLQGTQSQLNFLPERHTDFIFSVVAEEGGFLLAGLLIFLFFLFVNRGCRIAKEAHSDQARLTAIGLTSVVALHVFVNLAMTMGFLPVVGLPLPFVSYGGSWLTSCWIAAALLLSISNERRD